MPGKPSIVKFGSKETNANGISEVNSINLSIFVPSVIRLKDYVRFNKKNISLNRRNILKRDNQSRKESLRLLKEDIIARNKQAILNKANTGILNKLFHFNHLRKIF